MCGLNEQDDVSNVYICTRHFQSSVYRIKDKRLRLHCGAIPTIDVLNPVVVKEESNSFKYINAIKENL